MSNQELALQLKSMTRQLESALPKQIPTDKFMRTVMMAVDNSPELLNCDRHSLLKACQKAASDGLLPDGRDSALVVFGKQVQYLPMYQGLIKKMRNTGEVVSISANVVYENELPNFEYYIDEDGQHLKHRPLFASRGKMVLAYAIAKLKDGSLQIEVMTEEDINQVKGASRSANSSHSPWAKWPDQQWKKTVLRRICKYLPSSTELDNIYKSDNEDYSFNDKKEELDITPKNEPKEIKKDSLDALVEKHEQ